MKPWWILLVGAVACGGGEKADTSLGDDDDDDDVTDTDDSDVCADAPTWEGFAGNFFDTHCQGCHASDSPDRMGAPQDVTFDTEEQVLSLRALITGAATGPNPFMPPMGGDVTDQERQELKRYLLCAE